MSRILLIEDETGIRDNLREMLEAEGYEINEAPDGAAGIDAALRCSPDLVICDIMMPAKDGYEVLQELRTHDATVSVPFLFLTARADRPSQRRGMEMGAEDYLTKPFTRGELLAAVAARLQRAESIASKFRRQMEDLRTTLSRALPHELLTPLNGILGLSSILVEEFDSIKRREMLDIARGISDSGESLHRLVRRFLAFSEVQMADLDSLARERFRAEVTPAPKVEEVARRTAELRGRLDDLEIRTDAGTAQPRMLTFHLERCIEELVDNACRFSPGGTPILVVVTSGRNLWSVSVQDKGEGIAPERLRQILEGTGSTTVVSGSPGLGMGLSLIRASTKLYNGQFGLDSQPGAGCIARFEVPATE